PSFSAKDDSFLSAVGPFFDVYPRPHDGFHVEGALTFTSLALKVEEPITNCTSSPCQQNPFQRVGHELSGLGLVGGAGYEGWFGTQSSLGVLLRVQYLTATLRRNDLVRPDAPVSLVVPAVLLAYTYH